MPSFGLVDLETTTLTAPLEMPRHHSSTGTFVIPWGLYGEAPRIRANNKPAMKTGFVVPVVTSNPAMYLWDNDCILSQSDPLSGSKLPSTWVRVGEACISSATRNQNVLKAKVEAWSLGLGELYSHQIPQNFASGLQSSFQSQYSDLHDRIERLKSTRTALERKDEEEKVARNIALQTMANQQNTTPTTTTSTSTLSDKDDRRPTAIKRFDEILKVSRPIIDSSKRAEVDKAMNEARLKLRMELNRRVGQIANSREQVGNVVYQVQLVYNDAWRRFGPDLLNYCIVKTAEKIIEQAETQVSLHSPSAFPIAQVVLDLSVRQKGLMPVLISLMMERCPYAVPRYIPRTTGQSEQDHKLAMGYLLIDDSLEGDQAYTERMAGILCLLGAIMQSQPSIGGASPYGIANAWLWLASVLNIHPQPITPYLICSFLESAGYEMFRVYKENFKKIMKFIRDQYLNMIPSGSVSAKTRLELYVNAFFDRHPPAIAPPEGSILLM